MKYSTSIGKEWKLIYGLCKLCIAEELHNINPVKHSMLYRWYHDPDNINVIIVINNKKHGVLGSGVIYNKSILDPYNGNIGVFVKPEYRNKGIGSHIRDQLDENKTIPIKLANYGTTRVMKFYNKFNGYKL